MIIDTPKFTQPQPRPARSLYKIGQDIEAIESLLYEVGGDVSEPDVDETIQAWLSENKTTLSAKADGYGEIMRRFEAQADEAEAEAKRLEQLAMIRRNAAARLKEGLRLFMDRHGIEKIETPLHRFTLCQNGGKAPVMLSPEYEANPQSLPDKYRRMIVTYIADKDAIRRDLESGVPVSFARIERRGTHVRVK